MVLPTVYQNFIHQTRYARWLEGLSRRETWSETVDRYIEFMVSQNQDLPGAVVSQLKSSIEALEVMPSMRALMTAGPALERDNVAGFNCAYVAIDRPHAFDEMAYILMCGTGVGFSVERQHIANLPEIPEKLCSNDIAIVVRDSKIGWAKAIRQTIALLYSGEIPGLDTHKVRGPGARLKTFGGRASGPGPLIELYKFLVATFKGAAGRKLTSLECHDICCKIGEVIVSGGVRRSALLSLSNLSDQRMRDAKSGEWHIAARERRLANNSVAYSEKPEVGQFMQEWHSLYASKSGERGIFNRDAAVRQCTRINRATLLNGVAIPFGANPCVEIILRPDQFCNLTEIVARAEDTEETLLEKVRCATILGTFQSSLTNFRYLRKSWKVNCEEERLLGVSITGIMDCTLLNQSGPARNELLAKMRKYAWEVNAEYAPLFGVEPSKAITCVKPSGTVSQLVDASSGIHTRHSKRFVRRVRNDLNDPISQFLIDQGVQFEIDNFNPSNAVFSFPVEVPDEALVRDSRTAIEELETWLDFKVHWCDHNPSTTINVRESEWLTVGAWVYEHFDEVCGLSFLPHSDHTYEQAPYEELSKGAYDELVKATPKHIAWESLVETEDLTTGSQELACVGGQCEI